MKNINIHPKFFLGGLIWVLLLGFSVHLHAQDAKTKIVIIKETVDENGVKTVEKIEKSGADADILIQQMQTEEGEININVEIEEDGNGTMIFLGENGEEIEIDINNSDWNSNQQLLEGIGDEMQKRIIISTDGEDIDYEGNGEIPEDVLKMLEEKGIDFKDLERSRQVKIIRKGTSCNKAQLGVMVNDTEGVGVKVIEVMKGTAAEEAGMKEGDIIKAVNTKAVQSSKELIEALSPFNVGDEVQIDFERSGTAQQVSVNLKARPQANRGNCNPANCDPTKCDPANCDPANCKPSGKRKGHANHRMKKVEHGFMGVNIEDNNGVEITGFPSESPARLAGLQEADVITKVDRKKVKNFDALIEAMKDTKPNQTVKVQYTRDGKKQKASVVLGEYPMELSRRKHGRCGNNWSSEEKTIEEEVGIEVIVIEEEAPLLEEGKEENTLSLRTMDLFPNPNNGAFTVRFEPEQSGPTIITVLDINGRTVYKIELENVEGLYEQEINLGEDVNGIYFLKIMQGENVWTEQIIINE